MLNNFVIFLKKNIVAPLDILYQFIKSFVNLFIDIASTFFDSSFSSFSTSTPFVLFKLILLLKLILIILLSKLVFSTRSEISFFAW